MVRTSAEPALHRRYRYKRAVGRDEACISLVPSPDGGPESAHFIAETKRIARHLFGRGAALNSVATETPGPLLFQHVDFGVNARRAKEVTALWRAWKRARRPFSELGAFLAQTKGTVRAPVQPRHAAPGQRAHSTWIASGVVERVDRAAGTVTLWMGWPDLQTTPIVPAMPRWLLYSGVSFTVAIPRRCEDEQTLDGVEWWPFTGNGMDIEALEETHFRLGQMYTDPAQRPITGLRRERVARRTRLLEELLDRVLACWKAACPDFVGQIPPREPGAEEDLAARILALEDRLIWAFGRLQALIPARANVYAAHLRARDNQHESHSFACPAPRDLHNMAVRLLDCQANCVIVARELMDFAPAEADSLQEMVQAYAREVPSLLL